MGGEHEIILPVRQRDVAHGDAVREIVGLELRPRLPAVEAHEETELGAEEEDIGVEPIFLDDVGIAADARRSRSDQPLPCAAVVRGPVQVRVHVAIGVAVVGDIGDRGIVAACLDPADPVARGHPQSRRQIGPVSAAVARQLHIAVIGADPDLPRRLGTLGNRVDRRVHLGR